MPTFEVEYKIRTSDRKIHLESALGSWPACGDQRIEQERITAELDAVTCRKCRNLGLFILSKGQDLRPIGDGDGEDLTVGVGGSAELGAGSIVAGLFGALVLFALLAWLFSW